MQNNPTTLVVDSENDVTLAFARVDCEHWSHYVKCDGMKWSRVGTLYPTKTALLADTSRYQSTWGFV